MDNFTIGRTVSRKSSPDAMRICLGDFPGQVSALFVGCAHHRSWCFQRTRLCTWERRLSYFLTIASCPPYIRGALVYSLVHRGWIYAYIRVHIQKPYMLILELTNVKDMFRERYRRRRGSIVLWNEEVDEF